VVFGFAVVLGYYLGTKLPAAYVKLTHADYNRYYLDNSMNATFGEFKISEVISDEMLIVAYDYNSEEPRFFSKYFAMLDPFIYDVPVGNATSASAAAPTFFDPKVIKDGFGFV
jgi:patatin-like phospholipase/acyl hydrolase